MPKLRVASKTQRKSKVAIRLVEKKRKRNPLKGFAKRLDLELRHALVRTIQVSHVVFKLSLSRLVFLQIFVVGASLLVGGGLVFEYENTAKNNAVIVSAQTRQLTQIVAGGSPVQWSVLVKRSDIASGKYLAKLPRAAENITISVVGAKEAASVLHTAAKEALPMSARKNIVTVAPKSSQKNILALAVHFFFADASNAASDSVDSAVQAVTGSAPGDQYVDLSQQAPGNTADTGTPSLDDSTSPSDVSDIAPTQSVDDTTSSDDASDIADSNNAPSSLSQSSSIDTSAIAADIASAQNMLVGLTIGTDPGDYTADQVSALQSEITAATAVENDNTSSQTDIDAADTSLQDAMQLFQSANQYVQINYQTPAPQITAQATDTGEQVTVSAVNEDPNSPLLDVLASTKIPRIFKVGQESSIHIKWTNNGNQDVTFHAFDTDGDGYLDYVEWTVPHLSDQTFQIIFISSAFLMDANQNIVSDISTETETQDGTYATVTDGQIVRAQFNDVLDNTKDITLYAGSGNESALASVTVYPVYTDADGNQTEGNQLTLVSDGTDPMFDSINGMGKYRVLLSNLETPADTFDLKVSGSLSIDWIVDPLTDAYWVGGTGNWSDATNHWATTSGGSPGAGNTPTSTTNVHFNGSSGSGTVTINVASVTVATFDDSSTLLSIATSTNGIAVTGSLNVSTTLSGTGAVSLSGGQTINGGNTGLISAPLTLGGNETVSITFGTFSISSIISDGGSGYALTLVGGGTLTLSGVNTFTGGITNKSGILNCTTSANCFGAGGNITLGDSAGGSNTAFLYVNTTGLNIARPIVLASNTTGTLAIGTSSVSSISMTFSGGISGTNNLVIFNSSTTGTTTISTGAISITGTISDNGGSSGTTTISSTIGSGVKGIYLASSGALTVTGPITVNSAGDTFENDVGGKILTISGGVSGTGNVTLNNNSSTAAAVTVTSASLNNTGTVTNSGTSSGSVTITGGVGANVTGVYENSAASALTISTTALTVNTGGTIIENDNSTGSALLSVTGGISGTGNLTLNNNSSISGGVTVSTTALNNVGTVTNSGTGSGLTTVSSVISTSVTKVTQNSATNPLNLTGANTWTGGLTIKKGSAIAGLSNATTVSGAAGPSANTVTLGDSAGASASWLSSGNFTVSNPVTLATSAAGTLTIGTYTAVTATAGPTFSGAITLNGNNLTLSKDGTTGALTSSGGISGTGNITINNSGTTSTVTVSNAITITGTITNTGTSTGTSTLSTSIGSGVSGFYENASGSIGISATVAVNSGGTIFETDNTVGSTAILGLSGGVTGTGNVQFINNSTITSDIQVGTGSLNNIGIITCTGTGTGGTILASVIGTNVTSVVQNSATNSLTLSSANTWTGGLKIKNGVAIANISNSGTTSGAAGPVASAITLGDSAGGSASWLGNGFTITNPVTLASGAVGTLTMGNSSGISSPVFNGTISLNGNNLNLTSTGTTGGMTIGGGTTGTGNITINSGSSSGTVTLQTNSINNTGTITNTGVSTGTTTITSVIGSSVTGVIQSSSSATLTLSGANTFSGGLDIKMGNVIANISNSGTTSGAAGPSGNAITLGDASGASANLVATSVTVSNPVNCASGAAGSLSITNSVTTNAPTFSGPISLNGNNLTISKIGTTAAFTVSGGVTGSGNLTLNNAGTSSTMSIITNSLNNSGTITTTGVSTGTITISGGIGSNVTALYQTSSSSGSPVTVNSFITVNSGGTTLENDGSAQMTISGGVNGTGNLTIKNNVAISQNINIITGSINNTGTVTNSGSGIAGNSVTVAAVIGSNVTGVIENGASQLVLSSSSNTYTGTTTVTSGVLVAQNVVVSGGASGLGNATSAIILGSASTSGALFYNGLSATFTRGFTVNAGGGEIDFNTGAQTFTIGTNAISASGSLTFGGGQAITVNSNITGSSDSLTITGSTPVTLAGTNTFTAGVTISSGTLSLTGTLNDGGNFTNSGTFTANTSTVDFTTGTHTVTGTNTFYNLTLDPSNTITFPSATTQTIGNTFSCTGTSGNTITINASTPTSAATLSKSSGTVSCDYLSLTDSTASGGATWNGGSHSTAVSNVTGWTGFAAAPTFTSITDGTDPISVGSSEAFTTVASPNGGASTVTLYVCKANDFTGSVCGAGGEWCHSSAGASNPSCSYTILYTDAVGSHNYYGNIIDNNGVAATTNPRSSTFTVSNALPVASSVSINSAATDVILNPGGTQNVSCVATVTDSNGYSDIASMTAKFYRSSIGAGGTDDNANHYTLSGSTATYCTGSGTSGTCTFTFPVYYYADPTDAGSTFSAQNWVCQVTPTDNVGAGTAATSTIEIDSLKSLSVSSTIALGSLNPGQNTSGDHTATVTNTGNTSIGFKVSGNNLSCSVHSSVPVGNQQYALNSFSYGSGTALSGTATDSGASLSKPTQSVPTVTQGTYWQVSVPGGTSGTCSGADSFVVQ
jgi:hypothetical protein